MKNREKLNLRIKARPETYSHKNKLNQSTPNLLNERKSFLLLEGFIQVKQTALTSSWDLLTGFVLKKKRQFN
jgi:hypothetical protein